MLKHPLFFIFSLLFCFPATSEPWIDTSNIFLRAQIQYLSDKGHIKTPITTYPLMWNNIADDLNEVFPHLLDENSRRAYDYVNHQLRLAKRNQKTIEVNISLEDKRFTSFGDSFRDKNNITVRTNWMSDTFAAKISTNYNNNPRDGDKTRYDGSYLATFLGNWVFTIGMQDRWWGPGWDSNLALTNNARPIPTLSLSRKSAEPFIIPFTEYGIPWTVTTFMGQLDDNRSIKDALLWGFRLNFKPLDNLEIGIIRLAQWGGDGRPGDASTFWNVFIGKDNCGVGGLDCTNGISQEPGNQQAGYDFRYTLNVANVPLTLYGQSLAEDGNDNSSFSFLTEIQSQLGIETRINILSKATTIFAEYTSTYTDCVDEDTIDVGNCFYEHHIYQTGMRYNQRTLGNLYDNDAKTTVIGVISNIDINTDFTFKLRYLKLNIDNQDKAPNNLFIGNPLTEIAEDILMVSSKVQHSYQDWRFTLGADLSKSSFKDNNNNKNTANIFINVEHNL